MAHDSLNLSSFVNQQIELQENIRSYLAKAQALLQVAINSDYLEDSTHKVIHNYLWALSDMVDVACEANENALSTLLSKLNPCDVA
jgi:hypothetical protein